MAGYNQILGGGGFHHVAIKVGNFDKSVTFYKEAFGFKEKITWGEKSADKDTRAVMLDTGDGNYLEIFAGGPATPPPDGSIIHMAFRTTNLDESVARVRAAGAIITIEPKDVLIPSKPIPTPVRLAFCKGFDGETIEFFQNEAT